MSAPIFLTLRTQHHLGDNKLQLSLESLSHIYSGIGFIAERTPELVNENGTFIEWGITPTEVRGDGYGYFNSMSSDKINAIGGAISSLLNDSEASIVDSKLSIGDDILLLMLIVDGKPHFAISPVSHSEIDGLAEANGLNAGLPKEFKPRSEVTLN